MNKGDLIELNGKLRVVRDVTRHRDGRVRCLTFAIRRCSWTRRPFTTKGRTDMYLCQLRVVKRGYGLYHTPLEVMLQMDVDAKRGKSILECCDVIGVVS